MVVIRRKLNICGVCMGSYIKLLLIQILLPIECISIKSDSVESNQVYHNKQQGQQIILEHSLSPHLDNNNGWRPVGHGDPLKNDPTFDYSPPSLDRVRYWAETNSTSDNDIKIKNRNNINFPQSYTVSDRIGNIGSLRKDMNTVQPLVLGFSRHPLFGKTNNNIKEDIPLLQPKFSGIRRSYYPNDLPMGLVPPPMQPTPTLYYGDLKIKKINEFDHKTPYFATDSSTIFSKSKMEPMNGVKFSKISNAQQTNIHSMSKVQPLGNMLKPSYMQRKPWLHELLQKEIVTQSKLPSRVMEQKLNTSYSFNVSPLNQSSGYSVPSSIANLENSKAFDLSEKTLHIQKQSTTTTVQPIIKLPSSPTPTSDVKLNNEILPNIKANKSEDFSKSMTLLNKTSLLSHIKHNDFLLSGPMYLIIEGHSKVKTYGQNEYDPSKPKIVPIIPKREPVAIISSFNDNLKTINKYPVKHLHTKTTPMPTTPVPKQFFENFIKENPLIKISKNNSVHSNNSQVASTAIIPKAVPIEKPSGMQEMLNLLDSVFATDAVSTNGSNQLLTDKTIKKSNISISTEE